MGNMMSPQEILECTRSNRLLEIAEPMVRDAFSGWVVHPISPKCRVRGFFMQHEVDDIVVSIVFAYNELRMFIYKEAGWLDLVDTKIRNALQSARGVQGNEDR